MRKFVPFEDLRDGDEAGDFNLSHIAQALELSDMQHSLLGYMLQEFDIQIWFKTEEAKDTNTEPTIEVVTFFQRNHVASFDLIDLIENMVEEDLQLCLKEELSALSRLRAVIDKAIKDRLESIATQTTESAA